MTDSDVMTLSIQIAQGFYDKRAELMQGLDAHDWLDVAVALVGLTCAAISICRMGRLTAQHVLLLEKPQGRKRAARR